MRGLPTYVRSDFRFPASPIRIKPAYNLAKLQERHREVLRLAAMGCTDKQIADRLNVTTMMVRYTRNSDLGVEHLSILRNGRDTTAMDVTSQIEALAPDALEIIRQTIVTGKIEYEGRHEKVDYKDRIAASKDILGKAGYVAPTRVQADVRHTHVLTHDQIDEIKNRARLVSAQNGNLIVEAKIED